MGWSRTSSDGSWLLDREHNYYVGPNYCKILTEPHRNIVLLKTPHSIKNAESES